MNKKRRKRRNSYIGKKMNPSRFHVSQIKFYIYLVPLCIFTALPIIFIIFHAFKPLDELFAFPPKLFVSRPTLNNFYNLFYSQGVGGVPVSRFLFNSIIVTASIVFLSILFSTLAGYALSKMKFKMKKVIFEVNTLALMFVGIAVAIPRYFLIQNMGLLDNILIHILPVVAIPVGLFLIKQFIDQIPDELIEAAKVDGASEFYVYRKIIIPLIKPAIATIAILAFQTAWNNVDTSSFYIDTESKKTLAFYLSTLVQSMGNTVAGQGMSAAAALIMFIPNLVLFIFLQSKVMDTMAHSGIK